MLGKSEGRRPLGRSRSRWEDTIKTDLREVDWDCMDWIHTAQNRESWQGLVNAVMNIQVPLNAGNLPD